MNGRIAICWLLVFLSTAPAMGDGRTESSTDATRRTTVAKALAEFDSAVAVKDRTGPEALRLYRSALGDFNSVIQSGVHSAALYYNVANTYLRLGEVGRSIVNYRRALRLSPGDEDIRRNLESARKLCTVQVPLPPAGAFVQTLFFWHFGTSIAARTKVAIAAYGLFWLLSLASLILPRRVPAMSWTLRMVAAFVVVVGSSVGYETLAGRHQIEGALIKDDVVLRKGNGVEYEPQLTQPLSQGVEFRLLETRNDGAGAGWYRVELRDGKAGWLKADQADII